MMLTHRRLMTWVALMQDERCLVPRQLCPPRQAGAAAWGAPGWRAPRVLQRLARLPGQAEGGSLGGPTRLPCAPAGQWLQACLLGRAGRAATAPLRAFQNQEEGPSLPGRAGFAAVNPQRPRASQSQEEGPSLPGRAGLAATACLWQVAPSVRHAMAHAQVCAVPE